MAMVIALNGKLVPDKEAFVSVFDHGFLYGMGLFETFRTYGGKPFLLAAHLRRMEGACQEIGLDYVPDEARINRLVGDLLAANGLTDAYFRLSVSAGEDALGLSDHPYTRPTEVLYVKPLPSRNAELYRSGRWLQLLRLGRNTPEGSCRFKSFHYMNPILGKRELTRYPWARGAEGLFLDRNGFVAEGLVSNIFWVSGGELLTPSLDTGILPGITREWVLETCRREGMEVREGRFPLQSLLTADEAFLTNSIQEIVPVSGLYDPEGNSYPIGRETPGKVTNRLMAIYSTAAGKREHDGIL